MPATRIPVRGAPPPASAEAGKDWLRERWFRSIYTSNVAYTQAEERARNWGQALGLLVVAFTTITGTALFTTLQHSPSSTARAVVGGVAAVSALLAAANTYFGFAALEGKYHKASVDYEGLKTELDSKLNRPGAITDEWIDDFRNRWLQIFESSPTMPWHTWRRGDDYVRDRLGLPPDEPAAANGALPDVMGGWLAAASDSKRARTAQTTVGATSTRNGG